MITCLCYDNVDFFMLNYGMGIWKWILVMSHGGVVLPAVFDKLMEQLCFMVLLGVLFCVLSGGMEHRDEFFILLSFVYFPTVWDVVVSSCVYFLKMVDDDYGKQMLCDCVYGFTFSK